MSDPWEIALVAAFLALSMASGILVFIKRMLDSRHDSVFAMGIFIAMVTLAAAIAAYLSADYRVPEQQTGRALPPAAVQSTAIAAPRIENQRRRAGE